MSEKAVVELTVQVLLNGDEEDEKKILELGRKTAEEYGGPIEDDEEFTVGDAVRAIFVDPDMPGKLIWHTHGWTVDLVGEFGPERAHV